MARRYPGADITVTRRDAAKLVIIGVATAAWTPTFAAPQPVRLPLNEFVANARLLNALRQGVAAMKRRKPSDPLSWFYQAAIHGVTDYLWSEQVHDDPDVHKVDRAKYWNQCPHTGQNSANFLPWHRAYTYHFEQILRMHTNEVDFAIPYWDYSLLDQREFPRAFGIQHLDGNTKNDDPTNINPLFFADRDYFLCGYEHPFTDQLPLTELSPRAVDASRAMSSPVFFGDAESDGAGGGIADNDASTRGLFEQSPHDQIHRSVGGTVQGTDDQGNPTFAVGGMATPPTAGFDPIFPVHHSNMDRLWARWACSPGKNWGKLPSPDWFDEKPWFFFDTTGAEVNRPRSYYFDYQALGVRFKDDDPLATPLQLPPPLVPMVMTTAVAQLFSTPAASVETLNITMAILAPADRTTAIALGQEAKPSLRAARNFDAILQTLQPALEKVTLTLHDVDIDRTGSTGYDAYLVIQGTPTESLTPSNPLYLGPISLFNHQRGGTLVIDQTFDITPALVALKHTTLSGLDLILSPYSLVTAPKVDTAPVKPPAVRLTASGFTVSRSRLDLAPSPMNYPHH